MSGSQIKSGAIISYVAIFFSIAAGLLYTPWMVKQIGVSDYGLYTLTGAFLSYFLIDFGLAQSLARFIAKYRAEGNQEKINNLLGVTTRIYLLIDVLIFLVLCVLFFFLTDIFGQFTSVEHKKFEVVYLIAGFFSLLSFPLMPVNGIMIAYERFFVLKMTDLVQKMLVIVLMVVALLNGQGLFALIFVNGLVGFVIKLYNFFYIRRKEQIKINLKFFDKKLAKELFSFSAWIFVIGIAQRLILNIVPTILGALSGTKEIAIFSLALVLEGYTWTFAQALNGLFLPKVSRMVTASDDRTEVSNLMIQVGRLQFLVIGLLITGMVVLGKAFIVLWMGEEFLKSYYVALFLIVPGLITLTQEIASTLLFVVNEIKYRALFYSVAAIISVTIGILLAPTYGAVGSAVGVGTALLLCHVMAMNTVYAKVLKLDLKRFFYSVHLKMFLPFLVTGLVTYIIQLYRPVTDWLSFILVGTFFVLTTSAGLWLFVMNSYEKELVLSVMKKLKK